MSAREKLRDHKNYKLLHYSLYYTYWIGFYWAILYRVSLYNFVRHLRLSWYGMHGCTVDPSPSSWLAGFTAATAAAAKKEKISTLNTYTHMHSIVAYFTQLSASHRLSHSNTKHIILSYYMVYSNTAIHVQQ